MLPGFSRVCNRRDPSDDCLHDRGRRLLSFLGAGLQLPDVSWGLLLAEAQRYIRQAPHLMLPGLFPLVVTGALVVVGEGSGTRGRPEMGWKGLIPHETEEATDVVEQKVRGVVRRPVAAAVVFVPCTMLLWSRSAKRRTGRKSYAKLASPIGTVVGSLGCSA